MGISAEPIHFEEVTRGEGVRLKIATFANTRDEPAEVAIRTLEIPEWCDIENVHEGQHLTFPARGKKEIVFIINTNHQFFPDATEWDEPIIITWESGEQTLIPLFFAKIIQEIPAFQGVFALDFGTSNSCYATKAPLRANRALAGLHVAEVSEEIPSAIFFQDAQARKNPRYVVGTEALQEIKLAPGQTYAYFLSIKRQLGVNHKRPFLVVDASPNTHAQRWNEVDIAAFIVRAILKQAQDEIGERVTRVVATYPTLFSRPRKEALAEAIQQALWDLNGRERIPRHAVGLTIDEGAAAAFGFVYEEIQRQFQSFGRLENFSKTLIAYDFGGGTIDIALMDIGVTVERNGRVVVHQNMRGLSGDPYYGGDNVTLQVFRLLKHRLALAIAKARIERAENEPETPASRGVASDIWGAGGGASAGVSDAWGGGARDQVSSKIEGDVWGAASPQAAEATASVEPGAPEIAPDASPEEYIAACRTLVEHGAIVAAAASRPCSILTAFREAGLKLPPDQTQALANELQAALDLVVPTRFKVYARHNRPRLERLARQVFYELWHEAEVAKVRAVLLEEHRATIEGSLDTLATYNDVPPETFSSVFVELTELERIIEPDVRATVEKAYGLYERANEQQGAAIVELAESEPSQPLQVLLAGNASRLPLVRHLFSEVFNMPESELLQSASALKGVVALGACEEHALSRAFGEGGLIELSANDFSERLPYAIGLCHPDLKIAGFENGFCPIFTRGTPPDQRLYLAEQNYALIHPNIVTLELYADYRDGALPIPLGLFDLTKPAGDLTQEEHGECFDLVETWKTDNAWDDDEHEPFGFLIELKPDWDLRLIDLRKNFAYAMSQREEAPSTDRLPFAGIH